MSVWTFIIANAMHTAGSVYLWLYLLRALRRPVAVSRTPIIAELQKLEASVS